MDTQGKKIFIIDDDSFLLDMYALKFGQAGYEVQTALGSTPALEKLNDGYEPDILLLDIVMPQMDGFEFLEALKEKKLIPDAVKIILSNRGQDSDFSRGQTLGAHGYIVKANTTPSEVIEQVDNIVAEK